jgi:hypothetical protein
MGDPNAVPPKEFQWKKGDPRRPKGGRPKGSKDRLTILRDRIIDAGISIDLNDPKLKRADLLKIAASLIPKEIKGEVSGSLEIRWLE